MTYGVFINPTRRRLKWWNDVFLNSWRRMENDSVELNIRQLLVRRSVLAARSIIHCLRISADAGSEPPRSASRVVTFNHRRLHLMATRRFDQAGIDRNIFDKKRREKWHNMRRVRKTIGSFSVYSVCFNDASDGFTAAESPSNRIGWAHYAAYQ